jgi:AraC family transcriptional regulator
MPNGRPVLQGSSRFVRPEPAPHPGTFADIHDGDRTMAGRTIAVEGFTLREGRHAGGSSLPWHRHAGPTICFIYAGSVAEEFADATLECLPGTVKITPAEEAHRNHFGRDDTHGLLVEADPESVERLGNAARVLEERASFHDGHLALLGWRLLAELRGVDAATPLAIEGLLLEVLAGAARGRDLRVCRTAPRWVTEARDLLHDPGQAGTLGELAMVVGVHPVTLARGFRRAYGCSVGAYLRGLRIARAARRLADSDGPLAEIALEAGFADQSHFSNAFRRETGASPSAFRRAVRER